MTMLITTQDELSDYEITQTLGLVHPAERLRDTEPAAAHQNASKEYDADRFPHPRRDPRDPSPSQNRHCGKRREQQPEHPPLRKDPEQEV